jgi:hypothetical protein
MLHPVVLDLRPEWVQSKPNRDDNNYDFARCLAAAVHAQAEHCLVILEHHPDIRPLYETGLKYVIEPGQPMVLKSIPTIAEDGGSDCKNLVAWRLAELWRDEMKKPPVGYGRRISHCKVYWREPITVIGINQPEPRPLPCPVCHRLMTVTYRPMPPGTPVVNRNFHAQIRLPELLPNGARNPETVEDTSRYLGM